MVEEDGNLALHLQSDAETAVRHQERLAREASTSNTPRNVFKQTDKLMKHRSYAAKLSSTLNACNSIINFASRNKLGRKSGMP